MAGGVTARRKVWEELVHGGAAATRRAAAACRVGQGPLYSRRLLALWRAKPKLLPKRRWTYFASANPPRVIPMPRLTVLAVALEAMANLGATASLVAIKKYVASNHPSVNTGRLLPTLKKAVIEGTIVSHCSVEMRALSGCPALVVSPCS